VKKAQQLNLTACFLRQAADGEVVRHMTCGFGDTLFFAQVQLKTFFS